MKLKVTVKRQKDPQSPPYDQSFLYQGEGATAAGIIRKINQRENLTDINGEPAEKIGWECGCMLRKCGACAMIINGRPSLACSQYIEADGELFLAPLSKFPIVRDLIVDREHIFKSLYKAALWLDENMGYDEEHHAARFSSSNCIMCGCCLEVCPEFSLGEDNYSGAVLPVNSYRIADREEEPQHLKQLSKQYQKAFFSGCGQSLSCNKICPCNLPVEELIVKSNAINVWKRRKNKK